jgi:hypothetical protein
MDVILHGLHLDRQSLGDLLVGQTLGEEIEYLTLAKGQSSIVTPARDCGREAPKTICQMSGYLG